MMENLLKRILLVDDDEDDYILTREILSRAKEVRYSLDWAPTFEAGWDALLQDSYAAVLIDYDLGMYTGIDLIRRAKAKGVLIPMIIYTGRGNLEIGKESLQAGAADYIRKAEADLALIERSIHSAIEKKMTG